MRTAPAPGSDPAPQSAEPVGAAEDDASRWGDGAADTNDEQLQRDVPPHW